MAMHLLVEMDKLKRHLLELGTMAEESVQRSVSAVIDRDAETAQRVIEADVEMDRREVDLEEECLKVLALHQPVASDLRFIIMVLKVNNDLERLGDLAGNIAERALFLASQEPAPVPFDFAEMGRTVRHMIKTSLDSMIQGDGATAKAVCRLDSLVDEMNRNAYAAIAAFLRRSPEQADGLLALLSVSKNLERIADHATNIAEDVIYMLEGTIVRHSSSQAQS